MGTLRPLVLLSPIIARDDRRSRAGRSRREAAISSSTRACPAHEFERSCATGTSAACGTSKEDVAAGRIPKVFYESDDPNRMVPIVWKPEDYMIVVTGDPLRNNAYVFAHNGVLGYPTGKKIELPKDWEHRLSERGEQGSP